MALLLKATLFFFIAVAAAATGAQEKERSRAANAVGTAREPATFTGTPQNEKVPVDRKTSVQPDKAAISSWSGGQESTSRQDQPRFSFVGKRDPFRPFNLNLRSAVHRRENLSPLERYELGQLKLVGIVWNSKEPTAMVEDAAGLGYTVKVGTPIGSSEGVVRSIKPNEIIIEEFFIDLYGARKKREIDMRISAERAE